MRENIGVFRGFNSESAKCEWIYGGFVIQNDHECIEPASCNIVDKFGIMTRVSPFSVGECTGLKDSNGRLIYENDIVEVKDHYSTLPSQVLYVAFEDGEFVLKNKSYDLYRASLRVACRSEPYQCRVIGFMLNGTELYECS